MNTNIFKVNHLEGDATHLKEDVSALLKKNPSILRVVVNSVIFCITLLVLLISVPKGVQAEDKWSSGLGEAAGGGEKKLRTTLVLAADYWCPYNCLPEDENQGFLVELARRALYIYGIDVQYVIMPWYEALEKAQSGTIDGILGISSVEGRDLYMTRIPIDLSQMHAFTRGDTEWVFDGISSMLGMRLGVIMDYMLDSAVSSYVSMNFPEHPEWFLIEDSELAVIESIANLIDGDSDIFIEDRRVVNYYTRMNGLVPYIRDAGKASKTLLPVNIALSSNLPHARKYLNYLEEGIASLKATGEYDDLRAKYGMDGYSLDKKDNKIDVKDKYTDHKDE